ncbi:MAG: hypothetical protein KGH75_00865 [Rhodospirillales bacterium]|nr:hypothetical protein [Rhodospirillales bacterium]
MPDPGRFGCTLAEAPQLPERALWRAVVLQAMADAGMALGCGCPSYQRGQVRVQAMAFLFGDGRWRGAREACCDAAGIDPAWLERRLRAHRPAAEEFAVLPEEEPAAPWDTAASDARKAAARDGARREAIQYAREEGGGWAMAAALCERAGDPVSANSLIKWARVKGIGMLGRRWISRSARGDVRREAIARAREVGRGWEFVAALCAERGDEVARKTLQEWARENGIAPLRAPTPRQIASVARMRAARARAKRSAAEAEGVR